MITKITNDNVTEYKKLFTSAMNDLAKQVIDESTGETTIVSPTIDDIESYFQHLADLVALEDGMKYTMLPIDEDRFVIDANSRAISIPSNFTQHGIAVQGDDVAEIVWFEIDRYYDIMDFYNTTPIVQWKHSSSQEIFTSYAWYVDINTIANKLIFGWPLDRTICEKSGDLEFSVRFISFEDDGQTLGYSFNTLPVKVKINPSLDLKTINSVIDTGVNTKIRNRIKNSIEGNISLPLPPNFILAMKSGFTDVVNKISFLSLDASSDKEKTLNLGPRGSNKTLCAAAVSTAKNIAYDWNNLDGILSPNETTIQTIYFPVKDENGIYKVENIDKKLKCYLDIDCTTLLNLDNMEEYQDNVEEIFIQESSLGNFLKVYIANRDYTSYTISTPGTYWVVAKNVLSDVDNYAPGLFVANSQKVVVPEPVAPVFNSYEMNNSATSKIVLTDKAIGEKIKGNFTVPTDNDLTYQWKKKSQSNGTYSNIEGETKEELTLTSNLETGYYMVEVVNHYNNGNAIMQVPQNKNNDLFIVHEPSVSIRYVEGTTYKVIFSIDIGAKADLPYEIYGDTITAIATFTRPVNDTFEIASEKVEVSLKNLTETNSSYTDNHILEVTMIFKELAVPNVQVNKIEANLNGVYITDELK